MRQVSHRSAAALESCEADKRYQPKTATAIAIVLRPDAEEKGMETTAAMPAHPRPAPTLWSTGSAAGSSALYDRIDEQTVNEAAGAIVPLR